MPTVTLWDAHHDFSSDRPAGNHVLRVSKILLTIYGIELGGKRDIQGKYG